MRILSRFFMIRFSVSLHFLFAWPITEWCNKMAHHNSQFFNYSCSFIDYSLCVFEAISLGSSKIKLCFPWELHLYYVMTTCISSNAFFLFSSFSILIVIQTLFYHFPVRFLLHPYTFSILSLCFRWISHKQRKFDF